MEASEKEKTINPWKDRASFPQQSVAKIVLALFVVALCAFSLSCFVDERITLIVLIALFVYVVATLRTPAAVALMLLCAVAAYFMTGMLEGASVVLALIVGTATLAWLFTVLRPPYVATLALVVAFGASWAITRDAYCAALAFSFLPASVLLACATTSGRARVSAVCWAQIGLLLALLAIVLVVVARIYGGMSTDIIARAIADARTNSVRLLTELRDAWITSVGKVEGSAEMITQIKQTLSDEVLQATVTTLLYSLPGICAAACGVIAFEAQLLLGTMYLRTGWKQVLTRETCIFAMSVTSCVLYVIALFVYLCFGTGSLFGVAMYNLYLILLPGLCVMGLGALTARRGRSGGARILMILLFGALFCCATNYALPFLGLWGALANITVHLQKRRENQDGRN